MPWSTKYDCCQTCGTTDRKHAANGDCYGCYHRHMPDVIVAKYQARKTARYHANPELRQREITRAVEWNKRNKPRVWPVGKTVRVLVGKVNQSWRIGVIVERSPSLARVEINGRIHRISVPHQIMTTEDYDASVERDREVAA